MNFDTKTINLRLIDESDAEFVLSLRLDPRYNNFLSNVTADVEAQRSWITEYQKDEKLKKQFYFIIELLDGTPCGTVRIYDFQDDSFSWGSWILNDDKSRFAAIESALLVYDFGFNQLDFKKCHFEVRKKNKKVISFHKKFGAMITGEDEHNYYFEILPKSIVQMKERFTDFK